MGSLWERCLEFKGFALIQATKSVTVLASLQTAVYLGLSIEQQLHKIAVMQNSARGKYSEEKL